MDSIKLWVTSFSGALLISSLFKILVSNSSLKNVVNIFLSVLIFLHTLLPVENINSDFAGKYSFEEIKLYERDEYYKESYEKIIIKSIENVCSENNISLSSIEIDSYIDEDNNCCINQIYVYTNTPDSAEYIKNIIYEEIGIEVIVC